MWFLNKMDTGRNDQLKHSIEPDMNELKRNVVSRIRTFSTWPLANKLCDKLTDLAESGFWYPGYGGELKCAFCDILIDDWKQTDIPHERHKFMNPLCSLVPAQTGATGTHNGLTDRPVSVKTNSDLEQLLERQHSQSSWFEARNTHESLFEYEAVPQSQQMKRLEMRLASFENAGWPRSAPVSAVELAKSGWFYTGVADRVKCPHCHGCVYNWVVGDTGLGEHRRHFPHCSFVQDKLKQIFERPVSPKLSSPPKLKAVITVDNWRDSVPVRAVRFMHFDEKVIELAVKLQLSKGFDTFNAEQLMDAVFEVEARPETELPSNSTENISDSSIGGGATGYSNIESERHMSHCERTKSVDVTPNVQESAEAQRTRGSAETRNMAPETRKVPDAALHVEESETANKAIPDLELLKEENEKLKSNITCKICMDNSVGVLFLPCRHLICCPDCADSVRKCPLCRAKIIGTIKAFI